MCCEAMVEPRVILFPCDTKAMLLFRFGQGDGFVCTRACVKVCCCVRAATGHPGCLEGQTFVPYSFVFSCFSGSGMRLGRGDSGVPQNCCFSPFSAVGGGHRYKQLMGG